MATSLPKKKAFVDTTILTDILLKPGPARARARAGLSRFEETDLPVYAIKEFKSGPLAVYRWLHNLCVTDRSLSKITMRVHAMWRKPKWVATSLEAIAVVSAECKAGDLGALLTKYGASADPDQVAADEIRLGLRAVIHKAWKKRRLITTRIVNPLSCYSESDIREVRGQIIIDPMGCTLEPHCCLAPQFRADQKSVEALEGAVKAQGAGREHQKRYQALRYLRRKSQPLGRDACRDLGDAVFAFFAPADSVILTTNTKDHVPLAQALGKAAEEP